MAHFKNTPDEWQRLDFQILQNGAVSLYFDKSILADDIVWLKDNGYVVLPLDASHWKSENDFHRNMSTDLRFPVYYGENLNAFNDCISELEISESDGGCAIQLLGFDKPASALPDFAHGILDIIETNSRRFLLTGQRLIALVQTDDPKLSFAHLGCSSARWNSKEWLNKERGLESD